MAKLQGTADLPMIMPSQLVALRITEDAHAQDHRLTVMDVTARVHQMIIIPGVNRLANTVINRCMGCRIWKKQMSKQIFGDLPDKKLVKMAPFMYSAVDIFGRGLSCSAAWPLKLSPSWHAPATTPIRSR